MIHAFVVLCQLLNPYLCIRYEVVRVDYTSPASAMDCMRGGAIFVTTHPQFTVVQAGITYVSRGGVRCQADPPKATDISDWVAAEKARQERTAPLIK